MVKFNQVRKNPILLCIVDNRHLYQSGWATEISINITDFMIQRFIQHEYDIYIGADENTMLAEAATDNYSHAVVVAMGTSMGLSDRLFSAIENLCKQDFAVAGHILERNDKSYYKNGYYELHHQFYVVRLADYADMSFPILGTEENTQHVQTAPVRSEECLYNDHEVAAWIKPGHTEKTYSMKLHGWNLVATTLAHNKTIIDLGQDIRSNKTYFYYEYDHVFLRLISQVYDNQLFCNNFVVSWNSDLFKKQIPYEGPVEQYITVGTGVFWITYLDKLGITADTRVVFTDINNNCLQFMRAMVTEWDGVDYAEFYQTHLPLLPNSFNRDLDAYIEYTNKEWTDFVSKFDNWPAMWAKIKSLKFDFVLIDYMGVYNFDWIEKDKRTLLNLSDVFTHSPYIPTQSLKYRVSCENKLFAKLKERDPTIHVMMTSRAAEGFLKTTRTSGSVDLFEPVDINQLRKPVWHEKTWSSPRLLG